MEKSFEEAVQQGKDAIASWIMVADELGRPVPPPQKMKIA
jgi:predicted RNase H-like HicB family nuclease